MAFAARSGPARQAAAVQDNNSVCQLGNGVKHVVQLTFDNVHFFRDNPNVPSDLQMMPNLLQLLREQRHVLIEQPHAADRAHRRNVLTTTYTGLYGDRHGMPIRNGFRGLQRRRHDRPGELLRVLDRPDLRHGQDAEPRPRHQPVDGLLGRSRRPPRTRRRRQTRSPRRRGCRSPGPAVTSATWPRRTRSSRTPPWTSRRCSARTRRRRAAQRRP